MSVSPRGKGLRARSLGDYALRELDPLVAKRGFGEAALLLRWREIVGERIAGLCQPVRLQWPLRPRAKSDDKDKGKRRESPQEPATLALRVEPGFGLEAQHLAPTIIERVNAHLGWRCVARVTLRQEALKNAPGPRRPSSATPDAAAHARAVEATEGVAEEGLRAALVRLGERALAATGGA